MPAPVTAGLMQFMIDELEIVPWDGEVPRYDTLGNPINPQAVNDPPTWPVVTCEMGGKMRRTETFENAYNDRGPILIAVYGVTKASVYDQLNAIEALWGVYENWANVVMGGGLAGNPFYVIQMNVGEWSVVQQKDVRLARSELCFIGELNYDCNVHGALSTINVS